MQENDNNFNEVTLELLKPFILIQVICVKINYLKVKFFKKDYYYYQLLETL